MLQRFEKLSLTSKLCIAPVVAAVMLAISVIITQALVNSTNSQVELMVERDFAAANRVNQAESEFRTLNAQVFRTLTNAAADASSGEIDAQRAAVQKTAQTLSDEMNQLAAAYPELVSKAAADTLTSELSQYVEAFDVVASMLEIDFATAVSFVDPFEENYTRVLAKFSELKTLISSTVVEDTESVQSALRQTSIVAIASGVFVTLLVLGLGVFLGRKMSSSIVGIATATTDLANGRLDIDFDVLERGDELGSVVDALRRFRSDMEENEKLRAEREAEERRRIEEEAVRREEEAAREKAELEREKAREEEAKQQRAEIMSQLADRFNTQFASVMQTMESDTASLGQSAQGLKEIASQNGTMSADLSDVADDVSSNIQTVATATEELSSSIREIARQVDDSSSSVQSAVTLAGQTAGTVQNLAKVADNIGEVVTLINEIAAQTNLLALNATIEAARAGEAGRGFAVVASEVKTLAGQTAKATDQISEQIVNVQSVTSNVVDAIQQIESTITTISNATTEISAGVSQQSQATEEISSTAAHVSQRLDGLTRSTQNLSESAKTNDDAADALAAAVASMQDGVTTLQDASDRFVGEIRAA
ncbi:MAG: methyl-accepting chemotaxis protein [Pseudomonadota bacterium]